jgi:transcriptional regulator with PAS, ATPase and Fis domain
MKVIGPKLRKSIKDIDEQSLAILKNYDWPGNIRELSNVIERAINQTKKNILTLNDLPAELMEGGWRAIEKRQTNSINNDIVKLIEHLIAVIKPDSERRIHSIDDQFSRDSDGIGKLGIDSMDTDLPTLSDSSVSKKRNTRVYLPKSELTRNKDLVETQMIINCLQKHNGNRKEAAKELGISRSSLYRKMTKLSIS